MNYLRGSLLTFEGGEGSGKTVLIDKAQIYLHSMEVPSIVTREPGGLVICEKIRNILLDPENTGMDFISSSILN